MREFAVCLTFGVLGVACCYAQTTGRSDPNTPDIAALQQKRIEVLQERVSQIEHYVEVDLVDRIEFVRPQMDLINARLDYAQSNDEKRKLLTELMGEYDKLIRVAEVAVRAPVAPPRTGQRPAGVNEGIKASSDLLLLKSERIRVQIMRDSLN